MRLLFATFCISLFTHASLGLQHGVELNGTSGHGTVPENPAFYQLGTGDFTLEALVRFTQIENINQSTILVKNLDDNHEYVVLEYTHPEGQRLYFGGRGGDQEWNVGVSNIPLVPNVCYHVAGVRQGSLFSLYLDGVLQSSATYNVGNPSNAGDWNIGWMSTSNVCRCFPGIIDEVRVWTVARSQAEIQQYMYTSLSGQESNLVGYWAMDDASGNLFLDSSVNSNHGSLTDGFIWTDYDCGPTVDTGPEVLTAFDLLPAQPNPFNPSTEISFSLPVTGAAKLSVFDLTGACVAILHNGLTTAGRHTVTFQASDLPSGIYIAHLQTEAGQLSRRVALVK